MQGYTTEIETDPRKPMLPLADRIDDSIGEASTVMGAMLTELIRRTLRGGVIKIDQELNAYVGDKVDATIADRTPALERKAVEVAEVTAKMAAAAVAGEEVQVLERKTEEAARALAGRIDETRQWAEQTTAQAAQQLTGRIEQVDQRATQTTAETAERLAGQIAEAEHRAGQTTQEINQQLQELWARSKKGSATFKARLRTLEAGAADLASRLGQEQAGRQSSDEQLRQELAGLRAEVQELRQRNAALTGRVTELERPRGLRALWAWLFRRKKKEGDSAEVMADDRLAPQS